MSPTKVVMSCHSDTVWDAAHISAYKRRRRIWYYGNLDNLVTVAAVFVNLHKHPDNVKIYFTMHEETTMAGAKNLMKREGKALYIALDITGMSPRSDVTIEHIHRIDKKKLRELLRPLPYKITFTDGEPDEAIVYGKKFPTFSLCLPVYGHIHGRTRTSRTKMLRYTRAVLDIAKIVSKNLHHIVIPHHHHPHAKQGKANQ